MVALVDNDQPVVPEEGLGLMIRYAGLDEGNVDDAAEGALP